MLRDGCCACVRPASVLTMTTTIQGSTHERALASASGAKTVLTTAEEIRPLTEYSALVQALKASPVPPSSHPIQAAVAKESYLRDPQDNFYESWLPSASAFQQTTGSLYLASESQAAISSMSDALSSAESDMTKHESVLRLQLESFLQQMSEAFLGEDRVFATTGTDETARRLLSSIADSQLDESRCIVQRAKLRAKMDLVKTALGNDMASLPSLSKSVYPDHVEESPLSTPAHAAAHDSSSTSAGTATSTAGSASAVSVATGAAAAAAAGASEADGSSKGPKRAHKSFLKSVSKLFTGGSGGGAKRDKNKEGEGAGGRTAYDRPLPAIPPPGAEDDDEDGEKPPALASRGRDADVSARAVIASRGEEEEAKPGTENGRLLLEFEFYHGLISRKLAQERLPLDGQFLVRYDGKVFLLCVAWGGALREYPLGKNLFGTCMLGGIEWPTPYDAIQFCLNASQALDEDDAWMDQAVKRPDGPLPEGSNTLELKWEDLDVGEKLGRGKFSEVYTATIKATGVKVALKILTDTSVNNAKALEEATLLSSYSHEHIVQIIGYFIRNAHVHIVTEVS
jgi:hypothetical protein